MEIDTPQKGYGSVQVYQFKMYDYDDNNKHDSIQENWKHAFPDIQRLLRGKGIPFFLHASGDLRCALHHRVQTQPGIRQRS